LKEVSPFEDSPFTMEKFKEAYNAHLANGLGNLVSRVMKMASTHKIETNFISKEEVWYKSDNNVLLEGLQTYNIQSVCNEIWKKITVIDKEIQDTQPFKLLKSDVEHDRTRGTEIMIRIYKELWLISVLLEPILPDTATIIQACVVQNKMPEKPLFLRK
jgi:methionyl-tRNA synthetase